MAIIQARDMDLATFEQLKQRGEADGGSSWVLHVPVHKNDEPASELLIELDPTSLPLLLDVMESLIVTKPSASEGQDHSPGERARRIRESLARNVQHSDSGVMQHEERLR